MKQERRKHARAVRLFEGTWHGAAGSGHCRIGDLSLGGCFVQTLAAPAVGEKTVVTLQAPAGPLPLQGEVRYVDPGMGFAVKFQDLAPEALAGLREVIATIEPEET